MQIANLISGTLHTSFQSYRKWTYKFLGFLAIPTSAYLWYATYRIFRKHADAESITWADSHSSTATVQEVIDLTSDDAGRTLQSLNQQFSDASAEGYVITRMKVPTRAIGAVIGKQGCNIKRIQNSTKTTINFTDRASNCLEPEIAGALSGDPRNDTPQASSNNGGEGDSNTTTSKDYEEICIKGLSHRVIAAAQEIKRIVDSVPEIVELKCFVDTKYIGRLIGKSGENIKRMQAESRARIKVDDPSDGPRCVTIRGTQQQIDAVKEMIDEIIRDVDRREASGGAGGRHAPKSMPVKSHSNTYHVPMSQTSVTSPQNSGPVQTIESTHQNMPFDDKHRPAAPAPVLPPRETLPRSLTRVDAVISGIVDCHNFSVVLREPPSGPTCLRDLTQDMTNYFNRPDLDPLNNSPPTTVKKDDFVAALYSIEKTWQRAIVHSVTENTNGPILVDVDYCDYGDCEQLPLESIRILAKISDLELRSRVMNIPLQAISVQLKGICSRDPSGVWSEEAIQYFMDISGSSQGRMWKVLCCGYVGNNVALVELTDEQAEPPRKRDLASELVRVGYAKWQR